MKFYSDLEWLTFNHIEDCRVWIDRSCPYYALNLAYAGAFRWGGVSNTRPRLPLAYYTRAHEHYRYGSPEGQPWDQYFVAFRGPRAERYEREGLLPQGPGYFELTRPEKFRDTFEELLAALNTRPSQHDIAVQLLEKLLVEMQQQPRRKRAIDPVEDSIRRACEELRRSPAHDWDFNALAQSHALSPSHFRRKFKEHLGLAPKRYLMRLRMDLAAQQLRETTRPIKVIADESGFPDIHYFTRRFRSEYSLTPGQYRQASRLLDDDSSSFD